MSRPDDALMPADCASAGCGETFDAGDCHTIEASSPVTIDESMHNNEQGTCATDYTAAAGENTTE